MAVDRFKLKAKFPQQGSSTCYKYGDAESTDEECRTGSSGDEEDYLSMNFDESKDVRPGIISSRVVARSHKLEKKKQEADQKSRTLSRKALESTTREAGLNTALSPDNKGFALLAKMGYKPGMAIGKQAESTAVTAGRKDPIEIELKSDRKGLGHKTEQKRKLEEVAEMRKRMAAHRQQNEQVNIADFRARTCESAKLRKLEADLLGCRKACMELDLRAGHVEPLVANYWPPSIDDTEEQGEENYPEEEPIFQDPASQLLEVAQYLRDIYFYCHWCGSQFENSEDLTENCPGVGAEAHDCDL